MAIHNHIEFEKCIARIFEEAGYSINTNVLLDQATSDVDIIAQLGSETYYVEVKYSQVTNRAIKKIIELAQLHEGIPVLITACKIDEKQRITYKEAYPQIHLVDISNLLFAVQGFEELRNDLISTLTYSVDGIMPKCGFLQIDALQHSNHTDGIITELKMCEAGRDGFSRYEDLCEKALRNVFSEDLTLWSRQQKSNNELFRFDLLCRIKEERQKAFWSILERYFNTKYVVFEFKNYKDKIGQDQIYTTERYLYAKALRSVAIIVAANGFSDNAYWAAKGCLRENGKLILLLTTDDLIKMNETKKDAEDPSDYLLSKLDSILIDLEK